MSKMRLGVRHAESPPLAERESIPGVGVPFALSGVEGSTERNGAVSPSPDAGPLIRLRRKQGRRVERGGGLRLSPNPPPIIPTPLCRHSGRREPESIPRGAVGCPLPRRGAPCGYPGAAGGPRRPTRRIFLLKLAHLLDTPEQRRYHIPRPNKYSRYLRRNHTTQGNQPRRPRGLNALAHPKGLRAGPRHKQQRHPLSPAPGGLNALAHPKGHRAGLRHKRKRHPRDKLAPE